MPFFEAFTSFRHNPHAPILDEFNRLAAHQNWGKKRKKTMRQMCLGEEMNDHLAALDISGVSLHSTTTGSDRLHHWQALCAELRIKKVPSSITQCKKVLQKTHVNIVDLMNARREGTQVKIFPSYRALKDYTESSDNFVRKEAAKGKGVGVLLRTFF